MTPPLAVTFDYWQTLVSERRGEMRAMQIDRWLTTLAAAGQPRTEVDLTGAFAANWEVFEERWRTNAGPWGAAASVGFVSEHLGLEMNDDLRAALIENFRIVGRTAELHPAPGVRACLEALKGAGCVLGIVCDVGLTDSPTLRARLDGFGLLDFFDAWSFSDETGWFKPAAEAFRPALEGLGVPADAMPHTWATTSAPTSRAPRRWGWSRCSTRGWPSSAGGSPSNNRAGWRTTSSTTSPRCPASSASRHLTSTAPSRVVRVWLHQRS